MISAGSAVAAAALAGRALDAGWRAVTGKEPPTDPEDPEIEWREAVAWAVLSGMVIGVARLLAARRVAAYAHRSSSAPTRTLRRG